MVYFYFLFTETSRRMRAESKKRGNGPQIGVYVSIAHRPHGSLKKYCHGLCIRIKYGANKF